MWDSVGLRVVLQVAGRQIPAPGYFCGVDGEPARELRGRDKRVTSHVLGHRAPVTRGEKAVGIGRLRVENMPFPALGGRAAVRVAPLTPAQWKRVKTGRQITMHEDRAVAGSASILEISLPATATPLSCSPVGPGALVGAEKFREREHFGCHCPDAARLGAHGTHPRRVLTLFGKAPVSGSAMSGSRVQDTGPAPAVIGRRPRRRVRDRLPDEVTPAGEAGRTGAGPSCASRG